MRVPGWSKVNGRRRGRRTGVYGRRMLYPEAVYQILDRFSHRVGLRSWRSKEESQGDHKCETSGKSSITLLDEGGARY